MRRQRQSVGASTDNGDVSSRNFQNALQEIRLDPRRDGGWKVVESIPITLGTSPIGSRSYGTAHRLALAKVGRVFQSMVLLCSATLFEPGADRWR
jgi:hypothetical protein